MNSLTHFFFALNLLLLTFRDKSILYLSVYAMIFAVLLDADQIISYISKKKTHHRRTWVQEPFGLILIGIPLDIIAHYFFNTPLFIIIIPFASHIFLDYISFHEVSPLAPFTKKTIEIGFIKRFPCPEWYRQKNGISELYITFINIILTVFLVL